MSSKKNKYKDPWASVAESENFGTLFEGMLKSTQYQSLSLGAKNFYCYCRVQARTRECKSTLYAHGKAQNTSYDEMRDFVFPAVHLREYGIQSSNACKYFKELIKSGFIDKKEDNKHRKKVNVYSFSNRWKTH